MESAGKTIQRIIKNFGVPLLLFMLVLSIICFLAFIYARNQTEFSSTMVLHKEIANDCYPSALCDTNGDIHIAWQSDRNGNWDIFYLHSNNGLLGKDFVCLTETNGDDCFPSLTEDEKGNIWVVWVRDDITGSSICGKIIGPGKELNTEEVTFISEEKKVNHKSPSLISIDSKKMLLAWISKKNGNQEIKYTLIHEKVSSEKKPICSTDNSKKAILGKTKNGKIYLLWDRMHMGESHLYLSFFNKEDQYFQECKILKSETGAFIAGNSPSLLVGGNNPSILFFLNESGDIFSSIETETKNKNKSISLEFSEPQPFSIGGAYESCPTAIEDKNGEIYLFWASDFTRDDEIFFYSSPYISDFQTVNVQYSQGLQKIDNQSDQFIKNLTRDPHQNNMSPQGYYCNDIFFSVSIINEELWVIWDSYTWDLIEENNRRQIKYVKMKKNYWVKPEIIVDTNESMGLGRDDRCPTITQTQDGIIWLFWHSDRYRKETDENFEICYIKSEDGGNSWIWDDPTNLNPFRLTNTSIKDVFPSSCSIDEKIFVVWQSDIRLGNLDILFCEFNGEKWLPKKHITKGDFPETYPQIASLERNFPDIRADKIIVAWVSLKGDNFIINYKYLQPEREVNQFPTSSNISILFPSISYVSWDKFIGKNPWFVWQYYQVPGGSSNIRYKNGGGNIFPVTDDFSFNERPKIIEFGNKIWFFWDSSGGGKGRGIYYKYMSTKKIPIWLWGFASLLILAWSFFLSYAGNENIRKIIKKLNKTSEKFFERHERIYRSLKFIIAAIITAFITGMISIIFF